MHQACSHSEAGHKRDQTVGPSCFFRPTVRDRVLQAAVVNVIEPIFERDFAQQSYGFRPGRGCKDALRRVDE